jgi:hypothetical protein
MGLHADPAVAGAGPQHAARGAAETLVVNALPVQGRISATS